MAKINPWRKFIPFPGVQMRNGLENMKRWQAIESASFLPCFPSAMALSSSVYALPKSANAGERWEKKNCSSRSLFSHLCMKGSLSSRLGLRDHRSSGRHPALSVQFRCTNTAESVVSSSSRLSEESRRFLWRSSFLDTNSFLSCSHPHIHPSDSRLFRSLFPEKV